MTALTGADYTGKSGVLTFAPGVTTQNIDIPIVDDALVESSEDFSISISGPTNASLASVSLYTQKVPQFQALLAAEGGELPRFYARVKALAALPKTERETALAAATGFRTSRASP